MIIASITKYISDAYYILYESDLQKSSQKVHAHSSVGRATDF